MKTVGLIYVAGLMACACSSNESSKQTGAGGAPSDGQCSAAMLTRATQNLNQALTTADVSKLPLAANATYHENLEQPAFGQGIWAAPLTIAHQRDFIDATTCESYSEIVVTDGHAYVLGFRLTLSAGKITDITSLVADDGDFHFDANAFLAATTAEDWSVVPDAQRPTREAVTAAGDAYFDSFNDTTIQVPYGPNCTRLEGTEDGPCSQGLPPPGKVMVTERKVLVDDSLGTAVSIDRFRGLPDAHLFRMVDGLITSIHAVIICDPTCTPPAAAGAGAGGATAAAGSGSVPAGAGGVLGAGGHGGSPG